MLSPSLSRITNRMRSSITELSFHGIPLPPPSRGKSVTHVSGTFCYLCVEPHTASFPVPASLTLRVPMQNKRVLSSLILAAFTASTAGAQCYQFSGPGATLQITISSFVSKNGPTFSNGTGYTTSDYFQGNNSLTIGGVTQTSISTTNTPTCVNCMIG